MRRLQRGISLVEVMIALGIGAFMLIGIISLVASVSQTRGKLSVVSAQAENGRYAMMMLEEELSLAGFWGRYHPGVGVPNYQAISPCVSSNAAVDQGFDGSALNFPLPVSGIASSGTQPSCISAAGAPSTAEVITVRRVGVGTVEIADIPLGNTTPYLQISNCELDLLPYRLSHDPSQLTLRAKGCGSVEVARPLIVRSFFIANCDDCANGGDGKPTLKMIEYANDSLGTFSMVSGVEDMHIQYGLDLDGDGGPDCYAADPAAATVPAGCAAALWPATAVDNWEDVVAVSVSLLLRSEEPALNQPVADTFNLGRGAEQGPFDDRFKRQVVSSTILMPNMAGPRE